jgi:hypothetical protein|tara:strand:+ start:209 stop:415 length:207 start_codon:yes stop_codon:yes gene_type:complete
MAQHVNNGARLAKVVFLAMACLVSTPCVYGQSDYYGISEDFGIPPAVRDATNPCFVHTAAPVCTPTER